MDDAYVHGVDLRRPHFLNCYSCGCEEGMTNKGSRCVFKKDGTPAGLDVDFTVIDMKQRWYFLKKGGFRWRTIYHYICGVCGAEQRVLRVDEFSEKKKGQKMRKKEPEERQGEKP